MQALPAVASGWAIAEAVSQFLAGRTADGLGWLGLLGLAALAGAYGTRQTYLRLGAIVEPLRDELVELIVAGALARSADTSKPPDTHAVARMTHQAEIVRDSYAGVLTVACTFVFTAGSTLVGLVTLVPVTLPYVIPPILASVLILRLLLRPFAARQRRSVIGEEAVADSAAKAVSGLRDVTACGGENAVMAEFGAQVTQQAERDPVGRQDRRGPQPVHSGWRLAAAAARAGGRAVDDARRRRPRSYHRRHRVHQRKPAERPEHAGSGRQRGPGEAHGDTGPHHRDQ